MSSWRLVAAAHDDGGSGAGKDEQQQCPEPPGGAVAAEQGGETGVLRVDVVDVAVEQFDVTLVAGDVFHGFGVAFVDVDGDGLDPLGDVAASVGVEEDKGEGGQGVVALVAWNEYPFEGAAAADTVAAAVDVVVDLRVVDFEDFGEFDGGSVDEHEIAGAADGETVGDGFVGTDFAGVGLGFDVEATYCPIEALGGFR